jgi:hypothetical protein
LSQLTLRFSLFFIEDNQISHYICGASGRSRPLSHYNPRICWPPGITHPISPAVQLAPNGSWKNELNTLIGFCAFLRLETSLFVDTGAVCRLSKCSGESTAARMQLRKSSVAKLFLRVVNMMHELEIPIKHSGRANKHRLFRIPSELVKFANGLIMPLGRQMTATAIPAGKQTAASQPARPYGSTSAGRYNGHRLCSMDKRKRLTNKCPRVLFDVTVFAFSIGNSGIFAVF